MSKAVKKTIITIGLALAAFLIICAAAMLLGGCESGTPAPSPSQSAAPAPSPEESGEPSPEPSEDASAPAESPADEGVRGDLDGDGAAEYSVTLGSREFIYSRTEDGGERYTDKLTADSGDGGTLFVEFLLVPGVKAADLAPGFADTYLDYTDVEYAGVCNVAMSRLKGEMVRAKSDKDDLSAWLIDTDKGTLAVVFVYSPSVSDPAFDATFEIINSLTLA